MATKRRPIARARRSGLPDAAVRLLAGEVVEHTDENRRLLGDIRYFGAFEAALDEEQRQRLDAVHSIWLREWLARR